MEMRTEIANEIKFKEVLILSTSLVLEDAMTITSFSFLLSLHQQPWLKAAEVFDS